jgi:hypothetical protein
VGAHQVDMRLEPAHELDVLVRVGVGVRVRVRVRVRVC